MSIIYKKRTSISNDGSLEEFLDILFKKDVVNYFDRTNMLNFENNFTNIGGDPSLIIPSNEFTFGQILQEQMDTLFNNLGNNSINIMFNDFLPTIYAIQEINKDPRIVNLILNNKIKILLKEQFHNIEFVNLFLNGIQIPVTKIYKPYNLFNDLNMVYVVFNNFINNADSLCANQKCLNDVSYCFDNFTYYKTKYNNDQRFELLEPLLVKCPYEIKSGFYFMIWLNICLAENFNMAKIFSDLVNKDYLPNNIFKMFDNNKFLALTYYRLINESTSDLLSKSLIKQKISENNVALSQKLTSSYPTTYEGHVLNTLYDNGSLDWLKIL